MAQAFDLSGITNKMGGPGGRLLGFRFPPRSQTLDAHPRVLCEGGHDVAYTTIVALGSSAASIFPQSIVTSNLVPPSKSRNHGRGHDGRANPHRHASKSFVSRILVSKDYYSLDTNDILSLP